MRGISLKTIFIILIIALLFGAIYIKFFNKNETTAIEKIQKEENDNNKIIANNIRIGIIEFDNINPILSNNKNVQDISRLIFDPLFAITEDYKLKKSLATECSKLDDITYVIKLREDVKWQDGNKFDVSDVIFTIDMIKREDNSSIYFQNVANIVSLQEIDEYTLKIKIDKKIPYFEYNLIFPIVSSKHFNKDNFKLESSNLKPAGTGLFYISDVSNNSILLKKNVSGWNDQIIKIDSISLNLYNSLSNTIDAFKTGDIDMFTTSNKNIEDYLRNANYNKQQYVNRDYCYIALNCTNNVLSNKEVRQAINSAIDKEELIKVVSNGKYKISNFPLDFGNYVYDSGNTVIEHDKNVSKSLLIDNEWKYSSKRWRKTINHRNLTIELDLLVNKSDSNLIKIAKNIKEQLESTGMIINIKEEIDDKYNKYLQKKQYDMALFNNNYGYSPSLNKYFKEGNISNYKNEEIENLLNEGENIKNESELKQVYSKITEIYNDEVPYISLFYNTNTIIYSSNLRGIVKPNSYNLFYEIESWYREYKK